MYTNKRQQGTKYANEKKSNVKNRYWNNGQQNNFEQNMLWIGRARHNIYKEVTLYTKDLSIIDWLHNLNI